MRLGGPVHADFSDPDEWTRALADRGYRAARCPVEPGADDETIARYARAAADADVTIAEVPAFGCNPIHPDPETRRAAIERCRRRLALADAIGANCCVNVAGSRSERGWADPHPDNLTAETFDLIVDVVREIVDGVEPTRTHYALETMPWVHPDSPEGYRRLVEAVDRERFGVHFDPVNLVRSPRRYFATDDLVREFVDAVGPQIRSCHLKDVELGAGLTVHLDETRPGTGGLDYHALLTELDRLDPDLPVLLEHLDGPEEYERAADHVRTVASDAGVTV